MMKRLPWVIVGMVLGAAGMFCSMKYHVVRAEDGMHLVPKATAELSVPYVDIRGFEFSDWNEHRDLALAIVQDGQSHLLEGAAIGGLRQTMENVMQNLRSSAVELR